MTEDRTYCMNSFLMYRTVIDENRCFSKKYPPFYALLPKKEYSVHNGKELYEALQTQILNLLKDRKPALAWLLYNKIGSSAFISVWSFLISRYDTSV